MNDLTIKEVKIEKYSQHILTSENILYSFFDFLDVSPKTALTYQKAIKQLIRYMNKRGIKAPQRENIIEYKKHLLSCGRKPSTVALYLSAARRFFSWTDTQGIYPNIVSGIKAPKIDRGHKKDGFSGNQVRDILKAINRSNLEGMRNYAILGLMATCGLRTVEITRADVGDLRNVAGVTCLFIQGKGKTSKTDFVKLPPQVERAVRDYLHSRGSVRDDQPLFSSCSRRNKGNRLTTRIISGVAKSAMLNVGFQSSRLTAHSLRHTAITLALVAGQPLTDVQAFARHSSITTTMIYNHAINRMNSMCETSIAGAIFQ